MRDTPFLGLLRLQQTVLHRVADYVQDVGAQVGAGSVDPAAWFGGWANLWSGVVEDVGHWYAGPAGELRPWDEWLLVTRARVAHDASTASIDVDVPVAAFRSEDPGAELRLACDGLVRAGGGAPLLPRFQLALVPAVVTRAARRTRLALFDLKERLDVGDCYRGVVWSEDADGPVAAVEIEIV